MDKWADLFSQPINLLLMVFIALFVYLMYEVQKRDDFDWAQVWQDENGRVSSGRFMAMGAFISSTWVLMHTAVQKSMSDTFAVGYLAAWSGTMVASKAVDAYRNKGVADVRYPEVASVRSGASGAPDVCGGSVPLRQAPSVIGGYAEDAERSVGIGRERV